MKVSSIALLVSMGMLSQAEAVSFRPLNYNKKVVQALPEFHIETEEEEGHKETAASLAESEQQLHLRMSNPVKENTREMDRVIKS